LVRPSQRRPSAGKFRIGGWIWKPGDTFSAAKFKDYAEAKIADIQVRGKLPILVGGTGLYVDGVLYDFGFINNQTWRGLVYSWWSVDKLQKMIQQRDWPLPENARNRRHLVRTIERAGRVGSRKTELPDNVLLIGLMPPDEILKQRIARRGEDMFKRGIVKETQYLAAEYGTKKLAGTGIIYKIVLRLINGEIDRRQALDLLKTADWQYARRQKTWFRRNPDIKWFSSPEAAYKVVKKVLLNT